MTIARHTLAGEIAAREGKHVEAIANLREGARLEDGLRYDEPPDWIQPVRHTLGAVLLKAGQPAEAEAVYREDLQRHPHNAWSLYGLAESLRAQNKIQDANVTMARFQKAWARADVKISGSCLCLR